MMQLVGLAIGVGGETYVQDWNYIGLGIQVIKVMSHQDDHARLSATLRSLTYTKKHIDMELKLD